LRSRCMSRDTGSRNIRNTCRCGVPLPGQAVCCNCRSGAALLGLCAVRTSTVPGRLCPGYRGRPPGSLACLQWPGSCKPPLPDHSGYGTAVPQTPSPSGTPAGMQRRVRVQGWTRERAAGCPSRERSRSQGRGGWGEGIESGELPELDPLIPAFSATAPCVALPPTSLSASLREQGRRVCTAGVEFPVLAWLITCKAVHSEGFTDRSTD